MSIIQDVVNLLVSEGEFSIVKGCILDLVIIKVDVDKQIFLKIRKWRGKD